MSEPRRVPAPPAPSRRAPPNNLDAERAVLGSILIAPTKLDDVAAVLHGVDDFLSPAHRDIYEAMVQVAKREPVDVLAVADVLRANGAIARLDGRDAYLLTLSNIVPTAEGALHYARIVRDKAALRRLISACHETVARASGDVVVEDLIAEHQALVERAAGATSNAGPERIGKLLSDGLDAVEAKSMNRDAHVIKTHLRDFDEKFGGITQGYTILAARPGIGKCLGKGTPVLKFDGSIVPVERVIAGDVLMGPDSKPRRVLSTSAGRGALCLIEPLKGDSWVCNDVHVMTTVHSVTNVVSDIPLNEFLRRPSRFQEKSKLFSVGVEFPAMKEKLQLDPYFVGIWFGDGKKDLKSVVVYKPDREIADAVRAVAEAHGCEYTERKAKDGACPGHAVARRHGCRNVVMDKLRKIVGDGSGLPREYLLADRTSRLAFLAGLLDTDGHLISGCFEIVQKVKRYSEDICFLARSLGFRARMRKKVVNGDSYWRVFLSGEVSEIPTRIPRRQAQPRKQKKVATRTGFKVTPIGAGNYYGFTLDGDGRFLLGDFTVTHNTAFALCTLVRAGMDGVPGLLVSHEMSKQQILERAVAFTSRVEGRRIVRGNLGMEDWTAIRTGARKTLADIPLDVDDRNDLSFDRVCAEIRRWVNARRAEEAVSKKTRLPIVVVDSMSLLQPEKPGKIRMDDVTVMSRRLKKMADKLKIALVLIVHLSREIDKGKKPRKPVMSDLREAGALEQDADVILFPYREPGQKGASTGPVDALVIVGKSRNDVTGEALVTWDGRFMAYYDRAEEETI